MNKKGQAAMEFLMTYGWAILVVIAAIAALAYFGVLDPSRLLPEKCEFPAGLDCVDKPSIDTDASTVQMAMKNNIGFSMEILDVSTSSSMSGCELGNWSTNDADNIVPNNAGFILTLVCNNTISSGKFDETVTVQYNNTETGLIHNAVGVLRGKA